HRGPSRRRRAALPDRELGADPRRGAHGEADGPVDARRPDRVERRLLQPGREPVRALVEAWSARRRDGGLRALHRRRAARRALRLPADRQRHRRRGRVQAHHGRRAPRCGRPDDARRARDGHGREKLKTVFLVNPASANGSTGRRWPEISHRATAAGLNGDVLFSRAAGELTELARRAADEGAERLVVVGGDGSVHEVVNGIAQREGVEIAVIPRGTGWDFARSLGIPHNPDRAIEVALSGAVRTIDLGRATYRLWDGAEGSSWFANVGSAGMSGAIAQRANDTTKARGGKVSYVWATFAVFARWSNS